MGLEVSRRPKPPAPDSGPDGAQTRRLLWHDLTILGIRAERAAAARVAVRRVLEQRRPLGGEESEHLEVDALLDEVLDDVARRLGARVAERVTSDPYAYAWARLSFELSGALLRDQGMPPVAAAYAKMLGAGSLRELLREHLGRLERLLLGAAVLGGRTLDLPAPLLVELPFAVPGTSLTVVAADGRSTARLDGVRDGLPVGERGLRFEECPVVRRGSVEIRLQPYAWAGVPGVDFAPLVLAAGLELQHRNAARLERALALVQEHQPSTFEQIGRHLRVVAFKDPVAGSSTNNVTHTDLPGAFVASTVRHDHYLADVLIHEFHHNRLSCIEELGAFFAAGVSRDGAPQNGPGAGGYASPWRKDLRPLLGIVHGCYVHVPCTRFWIAVLAAGDIDDDTRSLALDRTLRGYLQLRCGLRQLERHARLSPLGSQLLAGLQQGATELAAEIAAARLPEDTPVTSCAPDGIVHLATRDDGSPLPGREAVRAHFAVLGAEDVVRDVLDS